MANAKALRGSPPRGSCAADRLSARTRSPPCPSGTGCDGVRIAELRGQRVILDAELAALYGVATKVLNQAVKRNVERFPEDFMFRLTRTETEALNRSQIVTGSQKHRDPRFPPFAFIEHGAIMAATVLNSPRAVRKARWFPLCAAAASAGVV
jgi:hypothetical protein